MGSEGQHQSVGASKRSQRQKALCTLYAVHVITLSRPTLAADLTLTFPPHWVVDQSQKVREQKVIFTTRVLQHFRPRKPRMQQLKLWPIESGEEPPWGLVASVWLVGEDGKLNGPLRECRIANQRWREAAGRELVVRMPVRFEVGKPYALALEPYRHSVHDQLGYSAKPTGFDRLFDLGTWASPVARGTVQVLRTTKYSPELGYGWVVGMNALSSSYQYSEKPNVAAMFDPLPCQRQGVGVLRLRAVQAASGDGRSEVSWPKRPDGVDSGGRDRGRFSGRAEALWR